MRRPTILLIFLLNLISAFAQQVTLSDSAKISLITCSPGQEVYEKFGHTGLRVRDPKTGMDVIFNYGVFDFDTPHFIWKFIKGHTDYQLGINQTDFFLSAYAERNSSVSEQELNLSPSEKRILFELLLENYRPENRTYRYNFVFDNCATRPRDKIFEALKGYVSFPKSSDSKTFRQWIGVYTGTDTWLKFGIDLLLGLEADRVATQNESMFLPEVLMSEFQDGIIRQPDGMVRRLINGDKKMLVGANVATETSSDTLIKPFLVSVLLLIAGILITFWDLSRKRVFKIFDTILLAVTGVAGLIIAFLMLFSVHPLVKLNLNILWLNPVNLILAIIIWIRPLRMGMFYYEILNIMFLVGALVAFALSIQAINAACFPLIVLMLVRTTSWFAITKKRIFKHRDLR